MPSKKVTRRILKEHGYELHKSRTRNPRYEDEGGYMIVQTRYNFCVAGDRYQYSLEDVSDWIEERL